MQIEVQALMAAAKAIGREHPARKSAKELGTNLVTALD
jgi:hypothetical protein